MGRRIYESMTTIPLVEYDPGIRRGWTPRLVGKVRVWRSERSLEAACEATNDDIFAVVARLGPSASKLSIIQAIEKLDRIEAIEIVCEQGNGALLYPNWGD
jgi:hypothetical protein